MRPKMRAIERRKGYEHLSRRRTFKSVRWRGHYFETLGMIYVDAGRVASSVADVLAPAGLHTSAGIGYRTTWNSQLSIRFDFAVSPEGQVFLLSFGNLF